MSVGTNFNTAYFREGFYTPKFGSTIYLTDGDYESKAFGSFLKVDVSAETRINNGLYWVSGLSLFQAGYSNSSGTRISDFKTTYLGVPLLVRVNYLNMWYIDIGMMARTPVSANLDESVVDSAGNLVKERGDIKSHLNSISLGFHAESSIVIKRILFTFYWTFGKQRVDADLADQWPLAGGSLFLRDFQPKFEYQLMGLKLGLRL